MSEDIILEPRREFDYVASEEVFYDMVVLGRGVAGLACGMYAGRLGMKVLVIGELTGGVIATTDLVENYPGFISVGGERLGELMENHAKDYDIDIFEGKCGSVDKLEEDGGKYFVSNCEGKKFRSKVVVFAVGSEVRKLGIPGEKEFEKRGVAYCALCDGPIFRGKDVAVVGGGNGAAKEALLLCNYVNKVYLIYRGERLKVEEAILKKLEEKVKEGKIVFVGSTNVVEVFGGDSVKGINLDKEFNGAKNLDVQGLFIAIGHIPNSGMAKSLGVKVNERGEVVVNEKSETNVEGVYAAGDLTSEVWKQAIIGVAQGVKAAYWGYEYVQERG